MDALDLKSYTNGLRLFVVCGPFGVCTLDLPSCLIFFRFLSERFRERSTFLLAIHFLSALFFFFHHDMNPSSAPVAAMPSSLSVLSPRFPVDFVSNFQSNDFPPLSSAHYYPTEFI